MKSGTLQDVKLRDVWAHGAHDFIFWLSNNLSYLENTVGMNLELIDIEVPVGKFTADIVCKNTSTNEIAIIEN